MNRTVLLAIAAVVLVALGALGVERWHVTDEERVEMAYDALRAAVEAEDGDALDMLLTADFSWSGPRPIHSGERDGIVPAFERFWSQADGIGVLPRGSKEITVAGGIATMNTPQVVRWKMGEQFIAYKVTAKLTFDRVGEGFVLAQIEVTELKPGLL